jgi:hypothetical protein
LLQIHDGLRKGTLGASRPPAPHDVPRQAPAARYNCRRRQIAAPCQIDEAPHRRGAAAAPLKTLHPDPNRSGGQDMPLRGREHRAAITSRGMR